MRFHAALMAVVILAAGVVIADDTPDVIAKIKRMGGFVSGDRLGSIQFSEVDKFKNGFSHLLKAFPNLTSLEFWKITDPNPPVSNAQVEDLTAEDVGQLKFITKLIFTDVTVDDQLLKEISELENLKSLRINGISIADTGLKEIAKLKNLTELELVSFGKTGITDVGLQEISKMKNLTELGLGGSRITDDGLKELRDLTKLTGLYLSRTAITDDGLIELRHHKNLSSLDLCSTQVSDEGLKEVGKLTELASLLLDDTKVTDDGLRELKNLKHLKQLGLGTTNKTTNVGIGRLLEELPNLQIMEMIVIVSDSRESHPIGKEKPPKSYLYDGIAPKTKNR